MDPESRAKEGKRFACDVCDHRFVTAANVLRHKQTVHSDDVFKCPHPGCESSSSRKDSVMSHLKGFHGTAGSFACDHPGCTFRSKWRHNIGLHKRQVHSNERRFACDHTGCSHSAKTRGALTSHKNVVHLNIRDKRCHVCEKGFPIKYFLRVHMTTHEGDGHEMAKCEDCSVNLKSCISEPEKSYPCHHQGCDYKSRLKRNLLSHQKQVHSEERPFPCSHTGCSYRCKTQTQLKTHQKRVHLKIKTKKCHVCDRRFFSKPDLRAHMMSQHQTNDHDMADCDNCVTHLKKSVTDDLRL